MWKELGYVKPSFMKHMFKERLCVMAAAHFDTGVKDLHVVYTMICNVLNDRSWQPQC
jgi:hypothetical protein